MKQTKDPPHYSFIKFLVLKLNVNGTELFPLHPIEPSMNMEFTIKPNFGVARSFIAQISILQVTIHVALVLASGEELQK